MNKKPINKRLIVIISFAVLAVILCSVATFFIIKHIRDGQSSQGPVLSEQAKTMKRSELVSKGIAAEDKGNTKDALESYKEARALCVESDEQCKNDMDSKVDMMNMYLKLDKDPETKPRTNPDSLSN